MRATNMATDGLDDESTDGEFLKRIAKLMSHMLVPE